MVREAKNAQLDPECEGTLSATLLETNDGGRPKGMPTTKWSSGTDTSVVPEASNAERGLALSVVALCGVEVHSSEDAISGGWHRAE